MENGGFFSIKPVAMEIRAISWDRTVIYWCTYADSNMDNVVSGKMVDSWMIWDTLRIKM